MSPERIEPPEAERAGIPLATGAVIVIAYCLLRLVWQQVVFVPYSFVGERIFFLGIVLPYMMLWRKFPLGALIGSFRLPGREHAKLLVSLLALTIVVRLLIKSLAPLDELPLTWRNVLDETLIPPLSEEPVFRGLVISSLMATFPDRKWGLILLSAAMFTAFHQFAPLRYIALMVLGTVLGILFLRTRSLSACMIYHAIWNALVFVHIPTIAGGHG